MGRIYQRRPGGPYHGYWTDQRGRQRRQALRTKDAQVARARLRHLELVSTDPATYSKHTLEKAITDLLAVVENENAGPTYGAYEQKARHLVRVMGNIELGSISRDGVLLYIKTRKLESAAGGTIHKELVVLRRALAEAIERKKWAGDIRSIVPSVKVVYHPKEVWLNEHQAKQFLSKISKGRQLWVKLAMYGGLNLGEIEKLRWEHINFGQKQMRVPGTKRPSRWRVIPIAPTLLEALEAEKPKRMLGPVVTKWANVRRAMEVACTKAKIGFRVTPNDLRRTFASWLKNKGVDSAIVARLLGHNSTKMVDLVYGKLSQDALLAALSHLPVDDVCAAGVHMTTVSDVTNDTGEAFSVVDKATKSKEL